jgi:LysR family transcriptional regulator, carnitine catabolism transcriptional activator
MDLRQLEYVVAIADTGSFTAAATAVHASQPSVSHGVRALEDELGVAVFVRLPRAVVATPTGESVIAAARQVLRDADTVRAVAADAAGLTAGRVDVATLPTLAADPVAGLVGRFRLDHPGVSVRLIEPEADATLLDAVASGRAELGFADLGGGTGALVASVLFDQELLLVAPPGATLPPQVSVAALRRQTFVATPPTTSTRRLLDEIAPDAVVAVEVAHREAIVPLVLAGAGAALLPAPAAEVASRRGASVAPLRPRVSRSIGLVRRPGPLAPAAAALADLAVEVLGSPSDG